MTQPAFKTIHSVHDADGNRIAEYDYDDFTQSSTLIREYIWMDGRAVAVVEGGSIYFIRTDHIGRPVFATDSSAVKVWDATYLPFGGVHTSTGTPIALRFPGQWFQSESALHQNWMRDYDPTTGRYIQADLLGLVDGASVYGYAGQNPGRYVDPRGEFKAPGGPSPEVHNPIGDILGPPDPPGAFRPNVAAMLAAIAGIMGGDTPSDNVIPFPTSDAIIDEDGPCGPNDCAERYKNLMTLREIIINYASEMGSPPPVSMMNNYRIKAMKYNAECVPLGYPPLPVHFLE